VNDLKTYRPNRRGFLQAVSAASLTAAGALSYPGGWEVAAAAAPAPGNGYPPFSWDRVPVAAQMGKSKGNFTASEAAFLASRFSMVALSAGTGAFRSLPADERYIEFGYFNNARILKAANPAIKVLFYWGWQGAIREFKAYTLPDYNPAWFVPRANGRGSVHDITNPAFRSWWASAVARICSNDDLDGIFIDGVGERTNPNILSILQQTRQALNALPAPKIMLGNGRQQALPGDPRSALNYTDGEMIEHFGAFESATPDIMRESIFEISRLAKDGKIVLVKGWPGFTFMDPDTKGRAYADKIAEARRNITFPLAAFLVAAQPYTYFQYGWGYENVGGAYVLKDDQADPSRQQIDPVWYPELLKPLGPPQGDAQNDGYQFTRQFARAQVQVDLQSRQASINFS
jgi:hypothetical protein